MKTYVSRDLKGIDARLEVAGSSDQLLLASVRHVCDEKPNDPVYAALKLRYDASMENLEFIHPADLAALLVNFVLDPTIPQSTAIQREEAIYVCLQSICFAESQIRGLIRKELQAELDSRPSASKKGKSSSMLVTYFLTLSDTFS